jgi:proline racemase
VRLSQVVTVVGCHAEGESGDVVTGGVGDVPGESMFDKMRYLELERDDLRRLLLREPRGGVAHSANVILPSSRPEARFGYVVMESTEYPVMSGSNTICVATVLLETGMVPMTEPVTRLVLEAPAGLISLECRCQDGKVTSVRFVNRPAFAYHLGARVEVGGLGTLTVDVAWGGMAYVLADAAALGFGITPDEARDLCETGQRIKAAAAEQLPVTHPENPAFAGITQTEFTGPVTRSAGRLTARNAVIMSPGRIDRSPCGTGTSARLAVLHARGQVEAGEEFIHESILGTTFSGRIEALATVGGIPAVTCSVAGQAYITGITQAGLDPADPFPQGYALSDTWPGATG